MRKYESCYSTPDEMPRWEIHEYEYIEKIWKEKCSEIWQEEEVNSYCPARSGRNQWGLTSLFVWFPVQSELDGEKEGMNNPEYVKTFRPNGPGNGGYEMTRDKSTGQVRIEPSQLAIKQLGRREAEKRAKEYGKRR